MQTSCSKIIACLCDPGTPGGPGFTQALETLQINLCDERVPNICCNDRQLHNPHITEPHFFSINLR